MCVSWGGDMQVYHNRGNLTQILEVSQEGSLEEDKLCPKGTPEGEVKFAKVKVSGWDKAQGTARAKALSSKELY